MKHLFKVNVAVNLPLTARAIAGFWLIVPATLGVWLIAQEARARPIGGAPPESTITAVYSALLQQQYNRGIGTPLIVLSQPVDRPEDLIIDNAFRDMLRMALSPISIETITAWEKLAPDSTTLEAFTPRRIGSSDRRPIELMSRTVRDSIFAFCPGGWDRFYVKYPQTRGYVTLSKVALDPAGMQALVYTEEYCGMWCAEGTFVFLEKEEADWKVRRKLTYWVS
jgi:hypothetical protein